MEGVCCNLSEALWGGDVVDEASNRDHVASPILENLPPAKELDEEVATVALVEELGDKVEVGDEGGLEDDGHV